MSWHCMCEDSTDNKEPWVKVQVAFIDGGIPFSFVMHAECLRKAVCEAEEGVIKEGTDNLNEDFEIRIKDAKETMERCILNEK